MTDDLLDVADGDDCPRPFLIGEAPSKRGDAYHRFPLSGPPARVLCQLAGIPPQDGGTTYGRWTWALYDHFRCRNLFDRYADATPWSAPRARDRARALLAPLEAERVTSAVVPPGEGHPQEEFYRQVSGSPSVLRITVNPPPVIVCLGRRVQLAVFGALDGDIVPARSRPGAWGTLFGDFGVWAKPWQIHTPIACAGCIGQRGRDCRVCSGTGRLPQRWAPHVVTIPHPSGLNRLLNDAATRQRCGDVLRDALKLAAPPRTVPE